MDLLFRGCFSRGRYGFPGLGLACACACSCFALFFLPCVWHRIKFNIEIEDATAAIEAAVFPEIAETIYGITGTNITSTAPGESLPTELLERLSEPKNSNITLRAYTYTYAGISQLKFTVHSMSNQSTSGKFINTGEVLALTPPTPAKTEKTHAPSTSEDPAEANPPKKQKPTTV